MRITFIASSHRTDPTTGHAVALLGDGDSVRAGDYLCGASRQGLWPYLERDKAVTCEGCISAATGLVLSGRAVAA